MIRKILFTLAAFLPILAMAQLQHDIYTTPMGRLIVTPINHASVMLQIRGKVIYIDPYELNVDFSTLPKADLILITHEHPDHLDGKALRKITLPDTYIIATEKVSASGLPKASIMYNGDLASWNDIEIEAVPAYNLVHKQANGQPYHVKGVGNGYIISFGSFRIYIAGDTEDIPEMANLGKINIAFLPKNLPYTMDDAQFIRAAKMVNPKVLYPYHYSEINRTYLRSQLPKTIELK